MLESLAFVLLAANVNAGSLSFGPTVTQNVVVPAASAINNLSSFTVVAWVYPTSASSSRILSKGRALQKLVQAYPGPTGDLCLAAVVTCMENLSESSTCGGVLPLNKWSVIAVTYDQAIPPKIYIGSETKLLSEPIYGERVICIGGNFPDAAGDLLIGSGFTGDIGTVYLIDRALSLNELQTIQRNIKMVNGTQLLLRLGYEGLGTQFDYSGNYYHGTIVGPAISSYSAPEFIKGGI